ncbi:oncostatin-M-specific receptor subunit beta isoform X2 [Hyla sarda]|nr:oncostatin-M-specific receptor subunit beta isoform X2 [Hyla sarda]XP_056402102.1 oncostatin-M-specific receptor subunit beta isoform X2 [Hyla sarda]XP_056402111.1 oncostatin-M-specific receptor subunit beta isoform X2 [Hyla sarda]XP_056402121.1 oncostatin-M-specific receptor subunit beta isoform X2 [Hyla sarda]XP_056402129.1 oncostatin-M-specific receptor subunit beta isoform X2 [Hyla sarda]
MDHCASWHGVIVTLFLILKLELWLCQEVEVFSPPLNLEIHNDSLHQRLLVEWNVSNKAFEPDTEIVFDIQVARSENMNIIANEIFLPDIHIGHVTSIRWTWDSQLPLECDSHSVRIRSKVVGKVFTVERNWSTWSPWKTHQGQNKERTRTGIYPYQRVVPEGSNVTFCCLPGRGQVVQKMRYGSEQMTQDFDTGTDSFVTSVKNVVRTKSDGTNVICVLGEKNPAGTVLIVSRLPDEPKKFSCETQDLQTLRCSWSPGPLYNFFGILKVTYVLQEWLSMKSYSCQRDHCVLPVKMNQQTYNFTLTARNRLGERSINSVVYLNQRVLLLAPSSLRVDHENASSITLSWSLRADYTTLGIQCQVDLQKTLVNVTSRGKRPTEIYKVSLSGLQPYTQYNLRVRCMADSSLAGWSNWTNIVVRTNEDAPTGALDVWRHIEEDDDGRIVTLYWRPSPHFKANGNISHYNIKIRPLEGAPEARESSVSGVKSFSISLGEQAYSINVTAHNKAGGSPPAELRIPAKAASGTEQTAADRSYGKDGGIYIMWQHKRNVHGYVVEWCSVPRSPHCDLQWKKYNSSIQSDVIKSRTFRPGVRYDFRIYGSMEDGEHLLEKAEGYTKENVSSVKPNVKISKIESRSIFLDWSPYPTDGSQEGFITGYNVYVNDTEKDCDLDKADDYPQLGHFRLCKFCIRDPNKMQITINKLRPNGKYEVAVVAITGGGETPAEFRKAYTPTDTGAALRSILAPVLTVLALALALLFIGCWKRTWLKRMCFPDIPDPNKSKIFSFDGKKGSMNGNILPTINHEPQLVDVVSIQEKRQHEMNKEVVISSEHQQHEAYTKIQTREGIGRDEDFGESYVPFDTEKSLYPTMKDPLYNSQPLCLEFFNQTYTSTSEDVNDNIPGYRPQLNITQVQCPPYVVQSVKPESGLDNDEPVICFNSPDYGSEPMSPTSVDSTAFILVD